jgi:hypothetical protein
MGQSGCPETSVRNYDYALRNNPEEGSSQLRRSGNLKSRRAYARNLVVTCEFTTCTVAMFCTLCALTDRSSRKPLALVSAVDRRALAQNTFSLRSSGSYVVIILSSITLLTCVSA